jgi:two-component system chemotaxis response regulator CheY
LSPLIGGTAMLIEIVEQAAEESLIHWVDQGAGHHDSAVLVRFSGIPLKPDETALVQLLRPTIEEWHGKLYILRNGDVVITWSGTQKTVIDKVITTLYKEFKIDPQQNLTQYFDRYAHAESLRLLCREHLARQPVAVPSTDLHFVPKSQPQFVPTDEQLQQLKERSAVRAARTTPEILIVEDQPFSRRLLRQALEVTHKVYDAPVAQEGFDLHFEHAPDICFLDVDLPDASGHDLAAALRRYDPQSFVVMVTANNYSEDVQRALANGAQGFIAKPYNKQKIIEALQKFHVVKEKQ